MSNHHIGYHHYRKARAQLLANNPPCRYCGGPADTADHVPPLASAPPGMWTGTLVPACRSCNSRLGASFGNRRRRHGRPSRRW